MVLDTDLRSRSVMRLRMESVSTSPSPSARISMRSVVVVELVVVVRLKLLPLFVELVLNNLFGAPLDVLVVKARGKLLAVD